MDIFLNLMTFDNSTQSYNLSGGSNTSAATTPNPPPTNPSKATEDKTKPSPPPNDAKKTNPNPPTEAKKKTNTNNGTPNKSQNQNQTQNQSQNQEENSQNDENNMLNNTEPNIASNTIFKYFKELYNGFILPWIITPLLVGSFTPALPFIFVMSIMYALLSYIMKFIRKL